MTADVYQRKLASAWKWGCYPLVPEVFFSPLRDSPSALNSVAPNERKNLWHPGYQFAVFTKNVTFSCLQMNLVPWQRNYQLWLTRWRLVPWPLHNTVFLHDTELKLSKVFFVWYQSFIASWYAGEKSKGYKSLHVFTFGGRVWSELWKFRGVLGIPANSPGFPGSLQVFHEISRSPG